MRAETFTGQVLAVFSRRTAAFQPRPGEPVTFPGRLRLLRTNRTVQTTARRLAGFLWSAASLPGAIPWALVLLAASFAAPAVILLLVTKKADLSVLALIITVVYFLPVIIAIRRGRQIGPVTVVNLFFGWSLLGWVVAASMALSDRAAGGASAIHQTIVMQQGSTPQNSIDSSTDDAHSQSESE